MKICFWGEVSKALMGKTPGGGELQISLLSKAFALSGNEVVVVDYEIEDGFVTPEGIKVIPVQGWNKGIRIIRNLTRRFPQLYRTLAVQKADVYYCRMRDFRHIIAYRAARKVHAKFVLGLSNGLDSLNFIGRCKYDYLTKNAGLWWFFNILFSEIVHPRLLHISDLVVAQHEGQANNLKTKGVNSIVLPSLIDLTEWPEIGEPDRSAFIYVGSLAKNKGFDKFYTLVINNPSYTYKILGMPRDKTGLRYYNKLKGMKNVKLFGRLDHHSTIRQIFNARALISTSPVEGFPNIFLEAWACGTPVLSLYVDPGNVIQKYKLGYFAGGNVDNLVNAMACVDLDKEYSIRAMDYIKKNHMLTAGRIQAINELFSSI